MNECEPLGDGTLNAAQARRACYACGDPGRDLPSSTFQLNLSRF